jgi:ABC-type transport system involved in Fe-S cluster assembly fused permease/ATPase subunit
MTYSLHLLTTWAQCDAVTAYATAKLGLLGYHDAQTGRRTSNLTTSATSDASELTGLNAYIAAMTPVIATLPEGKNRDKQANDLRLKTDRRDTLVARQGTTGPEVLVESELDSTLVDVQVPAVQDLLTQVAAHRLTLSA